MRLAAYQRSDCGHHEDRDEVAGGAQFAGDGKAVLAGQHDVEQDGLESRFLFRCGFERRVKAGQGCFAVDGYGDIVALGLQVEEQNIGEVLLVFDDQNMGRCCLLYGAAHVCALR
jgi:hypothetical protein